MLISLQQTKHDTKKIIDLLIKLGHDRIDDLLELFLLLFHFFDLGIGVRLEPFDSLVNRILNGLLFLIGQFAAQLLLIANLVLQRVRIGLELVLGLHFLLHFFVLIGKLLRVLDHSLYFLGRQPILIVVDHNVVLVASALVLGSDLQNAVDVNLESDLDLRHSPGSRRYPGEVKLSEQVIVFGHGTLSLEHLDGHGWLVVGSSGEHLRLLGGYDSVSGYQLGHHSSHSLNAHGQRIHVQQDHFAAHVLAGQHAALDSGAVGHSLVRVDASTGLFAVKVLFDQLLNFWNSGRAAH
ncbi:NAD-specific glutamate dehydrogenase [Brachionus plicatilis]|uniref:NAD-specific glutamate dehydrogenase n=1 Tax=Brachionus plicatilis TaxID=10195 RepID=A0A3M7R1S7_BRAPC|nr:NAD-specific glutamate dehydrogenase [Brachionus plicatilis]